MMDVYWYWFVLSVILVIFEIATVTLFALVFAISALITGIVTIFFDHWSTQLAVFSVTSLLGVFFIKPLLEKLLKVNKDVRNSTVDAMKGRVGVVTRATTETHKGRAKIGFEDWSVFSSQPLNVGDMVVVDEIQGATLIVRKKGGEEV